MSTSEIKSIENQINELKTKLEEENKEYRDWETDRKSVV